MIPRQHAFRSHRLRLLLASALAAFALGALLPLVAGAVGEPVAVTSGAF